MVHSHASIKESYSILGLSEDASLETVRSTYKRIALRTHPDKNPNNPNATQEFQQVSDAYNVLLQHLDPSNPAAEEYEWMEEEYDSEDEYFAHAKMDFYMFLFEQLFMRGAYRAQHNSRRGGYQRQRQAPGETPAEYQERLRRSRADQIAAEQRRKEEAAARKLRNEQERERERVEAEQRRLDAIKAKKAQGEKERRDAAAIVTKARQKAQTKRSTVFAAARSGLVEKVKKGVWEDEVDPSGGEVQPGCEKFVNKMPNDPSETLLHIAVQCGSLDLVEWLQSHNADSAEARNGEGLTPFHIAVRLGHIPIMNYFFDNHDPKDEDSEGVYSAPESTATLHLAILSHEPEVVYMILNNSLASSEEICTSWSWITSAEGRHTMSQKVDHRKPTELEKFNDILKLLMRFGGFTPPPTPSLSEEPRASKSGKKPYKPKHQRAQSSVVEDIGDTPSSQSSFRGRGGARPRARGRGRGRGQAPVTVPL